MNLIGTNAVNMSSAATVIAGGCLVAAPAIQAGSTFFWRDQYQGTVAGALIVVASVCWIVGLVAVFRAIEHRVPRYAAVGLPLAVYGAIGGVCFGVQGIQEELFGVPHSEAVSLVNLHPLAAYLAFWFPGPLFPLSLFVLGLVLARLRAVPPALGVLISVAAVVFPASRIPGSRWSPTWPTCCSWCRSRSSGCAWPWPPGVRRSTNRTARTGGRW
ncbi:hypothetical protein [Micromonospora zhanjiangensis]